MTIDCIHHWHDARYLNDGKERETKTSSPPKVPVFCCKCGAENHILAYKPECGQLAHSTGAPAVERILPRQTR